MSQVKETVFKLGHSPDPDDAFMFYALADHKIETDGYQFKHILQDIETLNQRATRGELHITAISIHAYAYVLDKYALLPCGASIGDGYGPVVVTLQEDVPGDEVELKEWLKNKTIAVPGTMTSAYLALRLFMDDVKTVVVPFDEIFQALRDGKADCGLIIHEGQLTYQRDGFHKVVDLGEWWKAKTGLPLPLGGNVIRKDIPVETRLEISKLLKESIAYGLEHRRPAVEHSMAHARDMDMQMADEFIGMYVNDYTLDYGDSGRAAIRLFLKMAHEAGIIPAPVELEFVE